MASDYAAIRRDHRNDYGAKVRRWGKKLLVDRYDDRSHFVYELLQNAEDALGARSDDRRPSGVRFLLDEKSLLVRHYGRPFDGDDVRSICAVAESTKDATAIGHFGVGFKSVFTLTDSPEVHSGAEDFRIEDFVYPCPVGPVERDGDETVFVCPLRHESDAAEVEHGLRRLGPDVLLFLRHIDSIEWTVQRHSSGTYIRESKPLRDSPHGVRRVTTIGETVGESEIERTWLVFSRPMSPGNDIERFVEIAFRLENDRVVPVSRSPLVVFFPSVLETNLGFVVQGPYRTTLSRDNVLRADDWNEKCVEETGSLLVEALLWLRDHEMLEVDALRSLPIDPLRFDDESMFAPLYEATKEALLTHQLLPTTDGGYAAASDIRIARTEAVRQLFDGEQLAHLLQSNRSLSWLAAEVTEARAADLREYLRVDLGVSEIRIEDLLPRLGEAFLQDQPHEWVRALYELLHDLPSQLGLARMLPLVRLSDGRHVQPTEYGEPAAFLPGPTPTEFPTVHLEVCSSDASMRFLKSLGLSVPDPVDDVLRNILPKYRDNPPPDDSTYAADFRRILEAFATDSNEARERLLAALRNSPIVAARDAQTGMRAFVLPGMVYPRTENLTTLFSGVDGIWFVDDSCAVLQEEQARRLLEACGIRSYLRTKAIACDLSEMELRGIRRDAGLETRWEPPPLDRTIDRLEALLDYLADLAPEERIGRARALWESLASLAHNDPRAFEITHEWSYSHQHRSVRIPAAFVRRLDDAAWVPDDRGELHLPKNVDFDSHDWPDNLFLQSKIRFRPPAIDQLAKEAGIESGVLRLLDDHGIRTEQDLIARLGLANKSSDGQGDEVETEPGIVSAAKDFENDESGTITATSNDVGTGEQRARTGDEAGLRFDGQPGQSDGVRASGSGTTPEKGRTGPGKSAGRRRFVSYVAVERENEDDLESDGLDRKARLRLEERAIALILREEPAWHRTPAGNPGFDLFQTEDGAPHGEPTRWCEVKAMRETLDQRPVGLSRAQFEFAAEHGEDAWLYVVERAGEENPEILRIQNPIGRARTFTFDRGWRHVAETTPED